MRTVAWSSRLLKNVPTCSTCGFCPDRNALLRFPIFNYCISKVNWCFNNNKHLLISYILCKNRYYILLPIYRVILICVLPDHINRKSGANTAQLHCDIICTRNILASFESYKQHKKYNIILRGLPFCNFFFIFMNEIFSHCRDTSQIGQKVIIIHLFNERSLSE